MRSILKLSTALTIAFAATVTLSACKANTEAEAVNKSAETVASIAQPAFSAQGLSALEARTKQFVTDGHVAGIATLLVKDGEVIQTVNHGVRNPETKAPIDDDTIYRIYSMTKPITGVALMQLYEQGKFTLDDPITKFIPEFESLTALGAKGEDGTYAAALPVKRSPTMRELMSHTAGFAYGLGGMDPANAAFREKQILASPDMDTFIDRVASTPLLYQPGEQWYYSAAVDIQGAIVERLSGQSFGAYLDEHIFAPLGMDDTGFYVPETEYDRLSDVFGYHPKTKEFGPYRVPAMAYKKETIAMESGGGGLVSTIGDYAKFCQMMLNDGVLDGKRILKSETAKLMRTNVLAEDQKVNLTGNLTAEQLAGLGFGLDFAVVTDSGKYIRPYGQGSFFWGGAAGTWFWIDPENDFYYIGMIQRFPTGGPEVDFRGISADLVYEALEK